MLAPQGYHYVALDSQSLSCHQSPFSHLRNGSTHIFLAHTIVMKVFVKVLSSFAKHVGSARHAEETNEWTPVLKRFTSFLTIVVSITLVL